MLEENRINLNRNRRKTIVRLVRCVPDSRHFFSSAAIFSVSLSLFLSSPLRRQRVASPLSIQSFFSFFTDDPKLPPPFLFIFILFADDPVRLSVRFGPFYLFRLLAARNSSSSSRFEPVKDLAAAKKKKEEEEEEAPLSSFFPLRETLRICSPIEFTFLSNITR